MIDHPSTNQPSSDGQPATLQDFFEQAELPAPDSGSASENESQLAVRQQQWLRLLAKLRSTYGEEYYKRVLSSLDLQGDHASSAGAVVTLQAKNRAKNKVTNQQCTQLEQRLLPLWQSEDATVCGVRVQTTSGAEGSGVPQEQQRLNPLLSFENYIIAEPNEFAFAAARRVAEVEDALYNPLFLFGGVGLGKTHLMTAIALYRQKHFPGEKILYLSAETFMRRFVEAIRNRDTLSFKSTFRQINLLLIDDIHFIAKKPGTQEEFFYTLNALIEQGHQVVLASDRSPNIIADLDPRVRSRLAGGLVAEISAPDQALRRAYLQSRGAKLSNGLPEDVLSYLVEHLPISIRELEGAMNRLIAHDDLINRPLDLDTCRKILRDVLHQPRLRLGVDKIQQTVAQYYRISPTDMSSNSRLRRVARPRQVAMYLCKQLTTRSLPEIGRHFGGRDHTTVLHAVRKVQSLCGESEEWGEDVRCLTELLNA